MERKSALEFEFEKLWAPPIMSLFTPADIQELIRIATSIRYNGNINKKYELIDAVMRRRGFRRAHCGTNRVVYNFLESSAFVAKVAIDKVGMIDSPAEYINQQYFQPFCCKIFEVDPSGVIAFVERVNPISSIEEFMSVADDVFNMMVTKIIGKYVVDDLGTNTFMNFGVRQNSNGYTFGPVIIDFPYVYELDGAKLKCQTEVLNKNTGQTEICNGDIDYKPGFNGLICTKCGREYKAIDLAKNTPNVKFEYDSKDKAMVKEIAHKMRARIVDGDKIIKDSGRSSSHYLSKEEFENMSSFNDIPVGEMEVGKTIRKKREPVRQFRDKYYTALQKQYYEELSKKNKTTIGDIMAVDETVDKETEVAKNIKRKNSPDAFNDGNYLDPAVVGTTDIPEVVLVTETVDRHGNVITNEVLKDLEAKTFPELVNNPTVVETVSIDPDIPAPAITEDSDKNLPADVVKETHQFYEASAPVHPYTDEQVKEMARAVAMQNNEDVKKEYVNTILDPEADKELTNPFTRPYAIAGDTVNVNHKVTAGEEQVTIPNPMAAGAQHTVEEDTHEDHQVTETEYDDDYDDEEYYDLQEKLARKDRDVERRFNKRAKRNNNNSINEY